jgi:hypothetical protein
MILKYVLLAISALSPSRESALLSKNVALEVKKAVREEILYIGYRLFFGVVLASAIVFSLFQLGNTASQAFDLLENGLTIKLLVFSFVVILGSVAMFFFFNSPGFKAKSIPPPPPPSDFLDFQTIALRFAEGFMDGMNTPAPSERSKSRYQTQNADF